MKSLGKVLRFLFISANVLFLILLILSAFSDWVPPDEMMMMAYLGLVFPFIFAVNICFFIYWIFARDSKWLLVCLCCFFLCGGTIRRYFPYHRTVDPLPQENMIKVLTYNVMNFAGKPHTESSPNRIIEYIAQSGADIVCLQEYTVSRTDKGLTPKSVYKALDMYPYRSVIELNRSRWGISGLAVFSKYPISNSRRIKYDSKYNGSSLHELDVNGKKVILINNHLESFKLTQKDKTQYSSLIKSFDSETLNEIRGTFQHKLGPAYLLRANQADLIADEIENIEGEYILVCGDFNDTPVSYAHRVIQGDLKDAFVSSGKGMGVTYNQNFFLFRIDNILHSQNMKSFNCTVDQVKYSDHYPMWCFLQMN